VSERDGVDDRRAVVEETARGRAEAPHTAGAVVDRPELIRQEDTRNPGVGLAAYLLYVVVVRRVVRKWFA
jgi:hypothetical protein